jgi:uncharacterized membrane protein
MKYKKFAVRFLVIQYPEKGVPCLCIVIGRGWSEISDNNCDVSVLIPPAHIFEQVDHSPVFQ